MPKILDIPASTASKSLPGNGVTPADAPGYPAYPFKFLARLLAARLAMVVS